MEKKPIEIYPICNKDIKETGNALKSEAQYLKRLHVKCLNITTAD